MDTSEVHVTLNPFDHCVPRAYYYATAYLPLKPGVTPDQAFDVLHEGLRRLFLEIPWLNGDVHLREPSAPGWREGQLEIRYKPPTATSPRPPQLHKKHLDTDLDFESLRELGFTPDAFHDKDLMPPTTGFFADPKVAPGPVFAAQANFLDGGCLLVSAAHHAVSDSVGYYHIMCQWAAQCAGLELGPQPEPLAAGSERHALLGEIWAREAPEQAVEAIDPETWRLVGLDPQDMQTRQQQQNSADTAGSVWDRETSAASQPLDAPNPPGTGPGGGDFNLKLKTAIFYLPTQRLAALTETIAAELGIAAASVGANYAVCALIWRCFMRARVRTRRARGFINPGSPSFEDDDDGAARLNLIYDGRATFSPALPPMYLGNLTFNVFSELPLRALIAPEASSLGRIHALLRANAGLGDQVNLLNLYGLLDHLPSYDELIRLKRRRMPDIDSNNMQVSSLMQISLEALCFGDGPVFGNKGCPEASRILMDACNSFTRTCLVLPRNRNGGAEVLVGLYPEELDSLMADKEFSRYALWLCG